MKEETPKAEANNYEEVGYVMLKDGRRGSVINTESIPDNEIIEEGKTVPVLIDGASKIEWVDEDEIVPKEKESEWIDMLHASAQTEFWQNKP